MFFMVIFMLQLSLNISVYCNSFISRLEKIGNDEIFWKTIFYFLLHYIAILYSNILPETSNHSNLWSYNINYFLDKIKVACSETTSEASFSAGLRGLSFHRRGRLRLFIFYDFLSTLFHTCLIFIFSRPLFQWPYSKVTYQKLLSNWKTHFGESTFEIINNLTQFR